MQKNNPKRYKIEKIEGEKEKEKERLFSMQGLRPPFLVFPKWRKGKESYIDYDFLSILLKVIQHKNIIEI